MYSSGLYRSSPIWLQEMLIAARGYGRARLREGHTFERYSSEAERTQWLRSTELEAQQRQRLHAIVDHAAKTVPFYRELYRDVPRAASWSDVLHRLPLIDKPMVRAAGRALLSDRARQPLFVGSTSGTTGAPLKLSQDLAAISRENAFVWRQLRWAGYVPGSRRAWIRGDMAVPAAQSEPPFWRHNAAERMLILSSYHLSAATADAYLKALSAYAPSVIQAYPSSIGFLAQCLKATDRFYDGASLTAIVTSSESVNAGNRAVIEERFGCKLFDWYGQFERVAAIGTCEHGNLHVIEDYGRVEFLRAEDGLHEIVGTGFNNRAMPLVRYRTGDFVELAATDEECRCGRHFRVVRRIVGRDDDAIKLPGGRVVGRMAGILDGIDGMLDAQIRQDAIDEIRIRVVPSAGWTHDMHARIERNARQRLGDVVDIRVETVDSIERDRNGKYRRVVCNV